jgi:hypothetical protein
MSQRCIKRTLLLVGEGLHDAAFLTHVKHHCAPRGSGLVVTVKNAHGKGALKVVNFAIRQRKNIHYDVCVVLVDTDTDYNKNVELLAKRNGIHLIASDPCIEALLLRVIGKKPGKASRLKAQFAPYVAGDPTNSQNYEENFGMKILKAASKTEVTIRELLMVFGVKLGSEGK